MIDPRMIDPRYDDVLERRYAEGDDAAQMDAGCQYDYQAQEWRDGHDHAHCVSNDESLPLLFCGATVGSCVVARELVTS